MTELKSFLGLLTYYGKFIPNQATHLAPLYQLLQKDQPGESSKKLLTLSQLLVHLILIRSLNWFLRVMSQLMELVLC